MNNKSTVGCSSSGGIGFVGMLTIAFIVLKLTGYISWPWIWVFAPIWIELLVIVAVLIVLLLAYAIISIWK